jgi:hypothetical protein
MLAHPSPPTQCTQKSKREGIAFGYVVTAIRKLNTVKFRFRPDPRRVPETTKLKMIDKDLAVQ